MGYNPILSENAVSCFKHKRYKYTYYALCKLRYAEFCEAHTWCMSFSMRSIIFISFSSLAAGAVLDTRDPVPKGYVAPPYYPGRYN